MTEAEQIISANPMSLAADAIGDPAIANYTEIPGFTDSDTSSGQFSMTRLGSPGQSVSINEGSTTFEGTSATSTKVLGDTVVQSDPSGGRIVEVIRDSAAPEFYKYRLAVPDGMQVEVQEDGSILIGKEVPVDEATDCESDDGQSVPCIPLDDPEIGEPNDIQRVMEVSGVIPAPWAYDAEGRRVPVKYVFSADVIRMEVSHRGAYTYPIVADPVWSRGGFRVVWAYTPLVQVYMNKARTADFADGKLIVCAGITTAALLAGPVAAAIVGAVCTAAVTLDNTVQRNGYCFLLNAWATNRRWDVLIYRNSWCR
ncbi:hypothetical protein [Promicromonospora soli]